MKNVFKFLIGAFAITMITGVYAQDFGIKAGLNLSNMLAKDDFETYSNEFEMNPGFHIGATAEFPLTDTFSFGTALLLTTKGFKLSEEEVISGDLYNYETKGNLLYLDIPLTAKASFDLGRTKIYGVFGPYLGFGLSGNTEFKETVDGETSTIKEDIEWGSDPDEAEIKRLDYGLTMGVGVQFNSIDVGLSYGLGLANISAFTEDGTKLKNRVLGISVGYMFSGN